MRRGSDVRGIAAEREGGVKISDFSVDNILKELDTKKSGKPSASPPAFVEDAQSLTEELAEIERKRFGRPKPKSKPDLSVTQIIDSVSVKAAASPPEETAKPVKIRRFSPRATAFEVGTSELPPPELPVPEPEPAEPPAPVVMSAAAPVAAAAYGKAKERPAAKLLPEEKIRLQKLKEEELLQKELALEDPDDLLDGLNPYDVKRILPSDDYEKPDLLDIKVTRDIGGDEDSGEIELMPENSDSGDARDVREYEISPLKSAKDRLGNSALLEKLNKKLAQKRASDINARRTITVDTLSGVKSGGDYKGRTLPTKLNIDYDKQIIEDSSVLPPLDVIARQNENKNLAKNKKRKIREFILEDIDDDEDDNEKDAEDSGEFVDYDTGWQILEDLNESHKGLKLRFALLFVLTAVTVFLAFLNDFGRGTALFGKIRDAWFGGEPGVYAATFIYVNLIAGVIGVALCAGVVLRGLQNLFSGKADCDSICALPPVFAIAAAAFQLTGTSLLQQGRAHIYVSAALLALLFNTAGKLLMIVRAKRNFRFISGDSLKYFAHIADEGEHAGVFTKGINFTEMPVPVFMRQTVFLKDYLKNSYCTDLADIISGKLAPAGAGAAVIVGLIAYFLPLPEELSEMRRSLCYAATAAGAFITAFSPFSIMFLVNTPLLRVSKSLSKSDSVVMGYKAAQKFAKANAVVIDANLLFPAGSVKFLNVKRCQKPGAFNTVSIDESIVIAASVAIKGNSIMSPMFFDMISGDSEILYKIENCIYEVNMGITGWMGSKRVMLGNREQMKHHGVEVPHIKKERKYCPENGEVVYLSVGGETVAMFFVEVVPNQAVKNCLKELEHNGFALSVKTQDSLVTVNKLADVFEFNPERIKILPFDLHGRFDEFSRYTSRGSSEVACNGTFTSFAKALTATKTLIRDMTVNSMTVFVSVFLAAVLGLIFVVFAEVGMLSASAVIIYNAAWLAVMLILQGLRRY